MKKIISIILVLLFTIVISTAQSRVNDEKLSFSSHSQKIINATGWCFNKNTGKWVSNKNTIDDKKITNSLKDYYMSHVNQNFKWIKMSIIIKENKKYHILIFQKMEGKYTYPSIYEDWVVSKITKFNIYTEKEYNILKKIIVNDSICDFRIISSLTGSNLSYRGADLITNIAHFINDDNKYPSKQIMIGNIQKNDNNEIIVRFLLPIHYSDYSSNNSKYIIKKEYFELNINEFKKLFR
jgi:hypothetical protein